MSRPDTGRTWMVTSRPTADCQSLAEVTTIITAPAVTAARKVIMATTAVSERPAIEPRGTIGVGMRCAMRPAGAGARASHGSAIVFAGSIVDMEPSLMQDQAAGVVLVHQRDVMRGDDDGSARFIELDEKPQQALAEIGIDIAGRLIGEQKLRARDYGAGDRRALLLAARQHGWQSRHAFAETHPLQQL